MNKEIDMLKKYKIGVLAGGPSSEREISLKSGKAVFDALKNMDLEAEFLDVKEKDFPVLIDRWDIEVVFIALHGRFGEDGTVQRMLEGRNIPYTGSGPEASRLALDKLASKERFQDHGLRVPEYRVVMLQEDISRLDVCFPCVIKPRYEGSSIGLSVVFSREHVRDAINKAAEFSKEIIVEKFVPGREITVGVLGDRPLPVIEIIAAGGVYDFGAKYQADDTEYIVPARLKEADYRLAQEMGIKAHAALGCEGFSRVDMRLSDEGEIFVLEVNTIPGLTERSLLPMAAKEMGLDFSQLCVKMLCSALFKTRKGN
jgi:D-alanine-D-alanine ligase